MLTPCVMPCIGLPSVPISRNSWISPWSTGRYGENLPLRDDPCEMVSVICSNSSMKCTAPLDSPLSVIAAPLGRTLPKYPLVPPPCFDIIPTSPAASIRLATLSSILDPKQLMLKPRLLPKFDHTGLDSE